MAQSGSTTVTSRQGHYYVPQPMPWPISSRTVATAMRNEPAMADLLKQQVVVDNRAVGRHGDAKAAARGMRGKVHNMAEPTRKTRVIARKLLKGGVVSSSRVTLFTLGSIR